MEKKAFTKELLKIAFAATVCDGDIDEAELEVIRALEKEDFYLKEEDLSDVLKNYEKDAADDFLEFANMAVKETYKLDLTPAEKMIVVNLIWWKEIVDLKEFSVKFNTIYKTDNWIIFNLKND